MRVLRPTCLVLLLANPLTPAVSAQSPDTSFVRTNYVKHEYRLAMRDGADLFTIVYVPKDASPTITYPIVIIS